MSAEVILYCDHTECESFFPGNKNESLKQVQQRSEKSGWLFKYTKGQHYCPSHKETHTTQIPTGKLGFGGPG